MMRLDLTGQHPSVDRAEVEPPRRHGVLLIAKLILTGVAVFAAGSTLHRKALLLIGYVARKQTVSPCG
jgi:hypothetical protein